MISRVRLAEYLAVYGVVALLAGGIVAVFRADAPPPAATETASPASPAAAHFTCKTDRFYLTNNGYAYFDNRSGRLTISDNFTELCEDPAGNGAQIGLIGEDNCLTYIGPEAGKAPMGSVGKAPCTDKVTQQWDLYANGFIKNAYTGNNWCLHGAADSGEPFMEKCNSRDGGQIWSEQT
jgi:hypothetical protein